jgi:hypothetical protein
MLPTLTSELRVAWILALSAAYIGWHTHDACAGKHASDDDGGDDAGDDGEEGDGGDAGEDEGDEDRDQPPVTAGGLFTMATYPINELQRPLTMTEHITQMRLGLGTDISAKGAFQTGGFTLDAAYGVRDNFTVIGGFSNAYNMRQFQFYAGFEGSLIYDLFDIRLAVDLHRTAIPEYQNYCNPISTVDHPNPQDPTQCGSQTAAIVNLPNGTYYAGDTQFSIDLGFPFRYAFNQQIAIVALQTLMKIDFNGTRRDHVLPNQIESMYVDQMGMPQTQTVTTYVPVGNSAKPDLVPSLGLATNPIPQLSIVAFVQLIIPDFDTQAGAFQVPVTLRVEASPTQKLDVGLAFTLLNVDPPDPQSPLDNRFLSAYVQARY